jgi:accessory gene regulator B
MALRKFSGGYHTKHMWTCLLASSLLLILCTEVSLYVTYNWRLALVTCIAGASLIFFSPIDHENRRLNHKEMICYKKIVIILVIVFEIMDVLCVLCGFEVVAVCFAIGIIMSAGLQIPCVTKR